MTRNRRLAVVVASEMTIKAFLIGHLIAWSERCAVSVFADTDDADLLRRNGVEGILRHTAIKRPVRPLADLGALLSLIREFRNGRFDAVFSVTPKAGLLAMLAGFVTRVPVRIHVFTGQVWVTRTGMVRTLFKWIDRLTASLATHVLTDSESQRQFLIAEGVLAARRSAVLGHGSISGVDVVRFAPDPVARSEIRAELELDEDQPLLLFLGRLNPDKGVLDLAKAFGMLAQRFERAHLLFVGPDEAGMRVGIEACCKPAAMRLHFIDYTNTPQRYMAAADVFCLPSYREGFGSVVIEAAAAGLPTVASAIYGLTDAVIDGETGLLHAPHDVDGLIACLERLLGDTSLCKNLGETARARAIQDFSARQVSAAFAHYMFDQLGMTR